MKEGSAARRRLNVVDESHHPAYVVWELTLRCDHACTHCGSRAVNARENELSTQEALGVVKQLASMKAREVVLIGGEAYLHDGFLDIVRALTAEKITVIMTTGGMGVTAELAVAMKKAGLQRMSVSIDGLEATHDRMRAKKGSFAAAMRALEAGRAAGITITANTNFNRLNRGDLEPLYERLLAAGAKSWQVQITAPLGRAADRPGMLLQPWDLLDLLPRIAELKARGLTEGLLIMPGNNLGYFGREEALLRSQKPDAGDHFRGCVAGKFTMGIESDGAVKGCPSLQTSHYVGGNVRDTPLREIWDDTPQLAFARVRTVEDLWGFCRTCPFAEVCMGGCTFTAHSVLGRPGNNPYCHFRASQLAAQGKRERLVAVERAPGLPFDNGRFELVLEDLRAPDPAADDLPEDLVRVRRPATTASSSS